MSDKQSLDDGLMNILVCYDGGDEARSALACVAELVAKAPANITILFVRPKSPSGFKEMIAMAREKIVDWNLDLPGLVVLREAEALLAKRNAIEEEAEGQPTQLRHGFKQLEKGLMEIHMMGVRDEHIRLRLRDGGDPAGVILNELDSLPYDMVVMGSRGKKGLKRWLMGSTAQRVALFSNQTVLVVRGKVPLHSVLLCTDGSAAAEKAVGFVGPLAKAKGCDLTVFGVANEEASRGEAESAISHAVSLVAEAGITAKSAVAVGSSRADLILNAAKDFDVTVLGVSGKSHMRRFLMGSVPLKVLENSPTSVMIVK